MNNNMVLRTVGFVILSLSIVVAANTDYKSGPVGTTREASLAELLGAGRNSEVQQAAEATKRLWSDLIDSLGKSDFTNSLSIAMSFLATKDVVEPYQKTFTSLVCDLLAPKDSDKEVVAQRRDLAAARSEQARLGAEFNNLKAQSAKLPARVVAGSIWHRMVEDLTKKFQDNEFGRKSVEEKISQLEPQLKSYDELMRNQIQSRVVSNIQDLLSAQEYRAASALANTYLRKIGDDDNIVKLGQEAVNYQKFRVRAVVIANAALKPATELTQQGRYWEARAVIARAMEEITRSVTDGMQLSLIRREISSSAKEVDRKIEEIGKEKTIIMEGAIRDAVEASIRFEQLHTQHPDLPDYEKEKARIADLHAEQISEKFAKSLASIEKVIPSDPDEAKAMIKRLMESGLDQDTISILKAKISQMNRDITTHKFAKKITAIENVIDNDPREAKEMIKRLMVSGIDPDDASVLKSKISKLNRDIFDREVVLITKDMNEAQSFLTKISSSIAQEIRQGKKPAYAEVLTTREGTENLVRARSLQAGAVKRLEVLLSEPEIENVTKSKLVGLLEAQKAALEQMDGTLHESEAHASKVKWTSLVIGGSVFLFVLAGGIFFVITRRGGKNTSRTFDRVDSRVKANKVDVNAKSVIMFDCPECNGALEVAVSAAGRLVDCPHCKTRIQIPFKTPPLPASVLVSTTQATPVKQIQKTCPFCGEMILAVTKKCRHCGEDLVAK